MSGQDTKMGHGSLAECVNSDTMKVTYVSSQWFVSGQKAKMDHVSTVSIPIQCCEFYYDTQTIARNSTAEHTAGTDVSTLF